MEIDRTACCIPQLAPNELYDAPSILTTRCIADSDDIMQKFGAAGAGKSLSAIAKRIVGVSRRKKKKEGTYWSPPFSSLEHHQLEAVKIVLLQLR